MSVIGFGARDVFVINDVNLKIPPTDIQIRKEDLTYQWKTLRTRSATKIPSGHGQTAIHVNLVFTPDLFLDMHRLIVEFRSSPFCYVENRYIRETIVPDWPLLQNMALTLTSMNCYPMRGSSDTWHMELDFVWFNYMPFTPNFLFRKDWNTNWIRKDVRSDANGAQKLSIGWIYNPSNDSRVSAPSVVETSTGNVGAIPRWDLVQEEVTKKKNKTVLDMEVLHEGQIFDLLPMPSNMEPSEFVLEPSKSRIYKRYINYLQRDSLLKHFDIRIEDDLEPHTLGWNYLFAAIQDQGTITTNSLLDADPELKAKWIEKMTSFHDYVTFTYDVYKEIRLPEELTRKLDDKRQTAMEALTEKYGFTGQSAPISGAWKTISMLNRGNMAIVESSTLSRSQIEMARVIVNEFIGAGFPMGIAMAAIVNARAESNLNPNAVGDNGHSIGLFQLYDGLKRRPPNKKAGGYGMSVPERQDPVLNTRRIIDQVRKHGAALEAQHNAGASVAELSAIFCRDIERPKNVTEDMEIRRGYARQIFPEYATMRANELPEPKDVVDETIDEEVVRKEILTETVEELKEEGVLDTSEAEAVLELFDALHQDGWRPYEDNTRVQNVWVKRLVHTIYRSKADAYGLIQNVMAGKVANDAIKGAFLQDDVVNTAVAGGLRHIVASIPVLSHEYPTQQHLGSIEPNYSFEFAIIDDNHSSDLSGISLNGLLIEGMKSRLQSNARNFRIVMDSWCLSIDSFVTRLLGTTSSFDYQADPQRKTLGVLKKNSVISASDAKTVPGQPGLSIMTMQVEETNHFSDEKIKSTAPKLPELNSAREKILQAIKDFSVFDTPDPKSAIADKLGRLVVDSQGTDIVSYRENTLAGNGYYLAPNGTIGRSIARGTARDTPYLVDVLYEATNFDAEGRALLSGNLIIRDADGELYRLLQEAGYADQVRLEDEESPFWLDQFVVVPQRVIEEITGEPNITMLDSQEKVAIHFGVSNADPNKTIYYASKVNDILTTAEMVLAEAELGGYTSEEIAENLYGCKVSPNQWQSFQAFLDGFIMENYSSVGYGDALSREQNKSFLRPNKPLVGTLSPTASGLIKAAVEEASNTLLDGTLTGSMRTVQTAIFEALEEGGIQNIWAAATAETVFGVFQSKTLEARREFVYHFMGYLPLAFAIKTGAYLEDEFNYWAGPLLGEKQAEDSFKLISHYQTYLASNNLVQRGYNGTGLWIAEPGPGLEFDGQYWVERRNTIQAPTATGLVTNAVFAIPDLAVEPTNGFLDAGGAFRSFFNATGLTDEDTWSTKYGTYVGAPSTHKVERVVEDAKLKWLRQMLTEIADEIRGDPEVLEILGLEDLAYIDLSNSFKGQECYPDLILPYHPYYEDLYQTSPDFYMWNLYEDGGASSKQFQADVLVGVSKVIENSYNSMRSMQDGLIRYDPSGDPIVSEVNVDELGSTVLRYNAEGTDKGVIKKNVDGDVFYTGPTRIPFDENAKVKEAEEEFYKAWENTSLNAELLDTNPPKAIKSVGDTTTDYVASIGTSNTTNTYNLKLGATDGSFQYPVRVPFSTYQGLWNRVAENELKFGSKAGYLGQYLTDENVQGISGRLSETSVAALTAYDHGFEPENLKKLAEESSKDIISQKMSMRRAYPTFKLYFVEEDEFESRFLNFDDFYSYNAVKDFTVVLSRKVAADFAVITIQNVSGTLDGTARGIVTDLDYFSKSRGDSIAKNTGAQQLAGGAEEAGTDQDQPFGSVILRPGLNVQLRAGYSNDPNALEVLVSGRVVDLTWNQGGDLVEIQVQGFGTELEQVLKGTDPMNTAGDSYATTHQLLGSLMIGSPELVHFGRWEFGVLKQTGEDKNSRLDFIDYSREGFMGRFGITDGISSMMFRHPYATLGLALGFNILTFLPVGRGIGVTSKFLKALGIGKAAPVLGSVDDFAKSVTTGLKTAGLENITGTAAKQAAMQSVAAQALRQNADDLVRAAAKLGNSADEVFEAIGKGFGEGIDLTTEAGMEAAKAAYSRTAVYAQSRVLAGQYIGYASFAPLSMTSVGSIAKGVGTNLLTAHLVTGVKLGIGVGAAAIGADILNNLFIEPQFNKKLKNIRNFFARTKASLFLSPQDDNLYPPSPKDYMNLERPAWYKDLGWAVAQSAGRLLFSTNHAADMAYRFFNPNYVFEKRVEPRQCAYTPIYSTIWDIFQEMTLRHPGWVFGCRPYGRDFRYTMFFGVPSQRYWSKPAPNQFIHRMNKLKDALDEGALDRPEYEELYGNTFEDGMDIDEYLAYTEAALAQYTAAQEAQDPSVAPLLPADLDSGGGFVTTQANSAITQATTAESEELTRRFTVRALKEYLHGLELRFVPWRRYHLMTSYRDIVWNGIISSESNVINAIDVTYQNSDLSGADALVEAPEGTELIKASSTLPEHMVRVKAVNYPNCKGYTMALRYGMGELLYSMRDMYRGEILLLGNTRIRPWDVGILVDTYNDMVGPIEVEQVVHMMSHEHGFLTEIKPSAIVLGNEISSWPIIEAMKLFSLAVQDMEGSFKGLGGQSGFIGTLTTVAEVAQDSGASVSKWATGKDVDNTFDSLMYRKYRDAFPVADAMQREAFAGAELPDQLPEGLDKAKDLSVGVAQAGLTAAGALFAVGSIALVGGGTSLLVKTAGVSSLLLNTKTLGLGAVAGGLAGATMAYGASSYYPSLSFLIGAPIILSKIMREDTIMVVPLTKNGHPIVSGLSFQDPSMVWKSFTGDLRSWANDALNGTRDTINLYQRYGEAVWRKVGEPSFGTVAKTAIAGGNLVPGGA